jgi:DNA-binding beta-propeller fold protein YncE
MSLPRRTPVAWLSLLSLLFLLGSGCSHPGQHAAEIVYGKHGTLNGEFVTPRAIAIDKHDCVYIVDFTARIQVFDRDGRYLTGWTTPDSSNGRPSGISITPKGEVLVSDSHYHCLRIYSPYSADDPDAAGRELRKIDPTNEDGTPLFRYIGDAVQDEDGCFYVAESQKNERMVKLDANGKFVKAWGSGGDAPGQFQRIRAVVIGPEPERFLYVADACNNRIQVFSRDGELVRVWGTSGHEEGQLGYPFDLAFGPNHELYVVEFSNQRVQKFTARGEWLGSWGAPGDGEGELRSPWGLDVDSTGAVHVLDTGNHRVQRIRF